MSCIKNFFKCGFTDNANESTFMQQNDWCEKNFKFIRQKIIELELDFKTLKSEHNLEIKRIEDKLINQIQILTTKIDTLILHFSKN